MKTNGIPVLELILSPIRVRNQQIIFMLWGMMVKVMGE